VKTILQIGALGALLASAPAWASFTFVNSFATGAATAPDGRPLAGQADFYYDSSANQLKIILTNTETGASPDSCTGVCGISQLLTGMNFTATGLTIGNGGAFSAAITTFDASNDNAWYGDSKNGPTFPTATTAAAQGVNVASTWQSTSLGSFNYQFDSTQLFVAPIANTSIQNNDGLGNGHAFAINQTAFILSVTGTLSSISGVSLNFGTGTDLVGTTATPEPGFYGLLSLGLAGLFFVRGWKKA
jgi:hypothetical protein